MSYSEKDNKLRLFYKGVELQNIIAWEARHPDFHNITFTVEGDFVELSLESEKVSDLSTEEFLVEQILQIRFCDCRTSKRDFKT